MQALTADTFFHGKIKVYQHQTGYRYSIDAILLSHFACPRKNDSVIDLGTGCAIIPLIMAYNNPHIKLIGIEIQKKLAILAHKNVNANDMENRIEIVQQDIKKIKAIKRFNKIDMVTSNPPYHKYKAGRINPDEERAIARHELKINLSEIIQVAGQILQVSGKFVTIYPVERMTEMIREMQDAGLEPKKIRIISSSRSTGAKLFLIEGLKGGRTGLKIAPPLYIYEQEKVYTEEVKNMLGS
jgi:tRNA1Val (adenine37-N6)-methyltransferase